MGETRMTSWLDKQEWLDTAAETVQQGVKQTFESMGPAKNDVKDALHGKWLGHPLHPALTDIPLGAWTATVVLDAMEDRDRRPGVAWAADQTLALGLVGAVGAAATGLADWSETDARPRRVGMAHAVLNVGATLLCAASLVCRRRGNRAAGHILAATGYLAAAAAAYLGGELVFQEQIGVNHAAGGKFPEQYTPVLADSELAEGQPKRVVYQDTPLLLARRGGRIHALADTCAHLGGPLSEGKLEGNCVTCPWHGSRFDLASGAVVNGPSVFPQPRLDARVRDGQIEVRMARTE